MDGRFCGAFKEVVFWWSRVHTDSFQYVLLQYPKQTANWPDKILNLRRNIETSNRNIEPSGGAPLEYQRKALKVQFEGRCLRLKIHYDPCVHVMVDKLCFLFDLEKTAFINLTQYISQVELPQPCDHGNFKKAPGRDNFTWGELSFHVLHAHSSETDFASIGIVSLWIHPRHRSPSVMHTTLY